MRVLLCPGDMTVKRKVVHWHSSYIKAMNSNSNGDMMVAELLAINCSIGFSRGHVANDHVAMYVPTWPCMASLGGLRTY